MPSKATSAAFRPVTSVVILLAKATSAAFKPVTSVVILPSKARSAAVRAWVSDSIIPPFPAISFRAFRSHDPFKTSPMTLALNSSVTGAYSLNIVCTFCAYSINFDTSSGAFLYPSCAALTLICELSIKPSLFLSPSR